MGETFGDSTRRKGSTMLDVSGARRRSRASVRSLGGATLLSGGCMMNVVNVADGGRKRDNNWRSLCF